MKKVLYPRAVGWMKNLRGSHSQQSFGDLIGKKYNSISDYEHGYVRPDRLTTAFLINYFNGDPVEVAGYLDYDPDDIYNLCKLLKNSGTSPGEFLADGWEKLGFAIKFREIESPQTALQIINKSILTLDNRIEGELDLYKDIKDMQEYKYLLLRTLSEKIKCATLLLPRNQVFDECMPIYARMKKLAMKIDERHHKQRKSFPPAVSSILLDHHASPFSGLALADSSIAAVYFVAQDYEKAIQYQQKALPNCEFDKNILAETYRGLLLSLAHTNRVEEVVRLEAKIEGLLGKVITDPGDIDGLRCAIAESRMLVGRDGSDGILNDVQHSIFSSKKFFPLKRIQFYKTQLYLAVNHLINDRRIDLDQMREVIQNGFSLAKEYQYQRHAGEIAGLGRVIEKEQKAWLGMDELSVNYSYH